MPRVMHVVLFRVRDDVTKDEIDHLFATFVELKEKNLVPGIVSFSYGPYSSPEGLNKDFNYGFNMVFESEEARDGYLPHPEHDRVKNMIVAMLHDGINSVVAFDYLLSGNNEV